MDENRGRDRLSARLMAVFLDELEEHVRVVNDLLLALERGPADAASAGHVASLLRSAHSLKGAARAAGVPPVERACHALEDLLSPAGEGGGAIEPGLFPLFFAAVDALAEAAGRLRDRGDLSGTAIEAILPRLEDAGRARLGPTPAQAGPHRDGLRCPATGIEGRDTRGGPPTVLAASAPEPLGPPVAASAPSPPAEAAPTHVRIPAEKLDALLTSSGELLVARRALAARAAELAELRAAAARCAIGRRRPARARSQGRRPADRAASEGDRLSERLDRIEKELARLSAGLGADLRRADRVAEGLDWEVRRLRMLPFAEACSGAARTVRDLAAQSGKRVGFVVEGGEVELDRSVLQGLKDPILHLVRNAVDHAIEPPDRRVEAGKPAAGRVVVSAALLGGQVEVVVADDGGGLDLEALRSRARREGWPEPADDAEATGLIFRPGVSTAASVTSVSGRGVGLDVVRDRVEALHGTIDVATERGRGTRFTLRVPLTLTTLRALLVEAAGQVFALAGTGVRRLVRIGPDDLRPIRGRPVALLDGIPWPVAPLAGALGLSCEEEPPPSGVRSALLVAAGDRRAALTVGALLDEQEVVVKGLGPRLRRVPHVSGATILPSGRVALVLNAAELLRTALDAPAPAPPRPPRPQARPRRLLVVDDSITTRTLEQAILESAGYEVRTAPDGEAGWRALNEHGADLVVSDVDMPRLDGFGLTEAIRGSERFRALPVVLVTARADEADLARGAAVGADAYLVKGAFDQGELLATVARLL